MPQITLLTGPERRRRWSDDERRRILAAAFTPGAIVTNVARQLEVSTSLIYKWRQQALAGEPTSGFAPAIMLPEPAATGPPDTTAIVVELSSGVRLRIGSRASAALVTATLRALR
ncbi:MAG TPA: transposase [Bradyrhizobium sp.]